LDDNYSMLDRLSSDRSTFEAETLR